MGRREDVEERREAFGETDAEEVDGDRGGDEGEPRGAHGRAGGEGEERVDVERQEHQDRVEVVEAAEPRGQVELPEYG